MRILVLSDAHHRMGNVMDAIEKEPTAKNIFYLGDGAEAVDELRSLYPDRNFYIVRGNCDWNTMYPDLGFENIMGKKIMYCHGHRYGVKESTSALQKKAKEEGADIVLFGHTHLSLLDYYDGLYIINPGSVTSPRDCTPTYAVIDITEQGILPAIIKMI